MHDIFSDDYEQVFSGSLRQINSKFHTILTTLEDSCLLGCDATPLDEWFPTFRRNALPSSSRAPTWPLMMKTTPSFETSEPLTKQHSAHPTTPESWVILPWKHQHFWNNQILAHSVTGWDRSTSLISLSNCVGRDFVVAKWSFLDKKHISSKWVEKYVCLFETLILKTVEPNSDFYQVRLLNHSHLKT